MDAYHYVRFIMREKINEMSIEEYERKLNEVYNLNVNKMVGQVKKDRSMLDYYVDPHLKLLSNGSEILWTIFKKEQEKRESEKYRVKQELIKPYLV